MGFFESGGADQPDDRGAADEAESLARIEARAGGSARSGDRRGASSAPLFEGRRGWSASASVDP